MMRDIVTLLAAFLLFAGAVIALIAALGLLRLPDLFTRMHAVSKAGTAGSGLALIAVALHFGTYDVWVKCLAAIVFFFMTAPISAHLLAKAARMHGHTPVDLDKEQEDDVNAGLSL